MTSFRQKMDPSAPKKLLSLDGGGIRGLISLGVLERLQEILREQSGKPSLVLSDYFDYIAGTSTGAIIAACLSLGMEVQTIRDFYRESAADMFTPAGVLRRLHYRFEDERLAARLQEVFGAETLLGSESLRTLLMLVLRNATTDSPWPISNNPRALYNRSDRPDCNLQLPLWKLVRASTAAPTYFPPEAVRIGAKEFLFVDGAVTMFNNPAFQLFLMATLGPYCLRWPAGAGNLLLVSVGTGSSPQADANLRADQMNLLYNAGSIPVALMYAAQTQQDLLCRVFGECRAGCRIDSEIGDLMEPSGEGMPKLFTYTRYNPELSAKGLDRLGLSGMDVQKIRAIDSVESMNELEEVGRAVASHDVHAGHLQGFLESMR